MLDTVQAWYKPYEAVGCGFDYLIMVSAVAGSLSNEYAAVSVARRSSTCEYIAVQHVNPIASGSSQTSSPSMLLCLDCSQIYRTHSRLRSHPSAKQVAGPNARELGQ